MSIAPKQLICLRSAPAARTVPPVPAGLTCFGGSTGNLLDWDNTAWAVKWNVKRATVGSGYTTIAITTTTHYTDTNAGVGTNYFYVVSAVNGSGESANSTAATVWANTDVGAVGLAGGVAHEDPTFTINGAGSDIGYTNDSCQYVYQSLTGDGTIVARIAFTAGNKDGLAMRETTNSNAAAVSMLLSGGTGNSILFYRATTGGVTSGTIGPNGITCPRWYKLSRAANTFTGYVSTNGTTWTTVGSASVTMANTITAGMEVCSRSITNLVITRFDSVTTPARPNSWQPLVARYPISGDADVLTFGTTLYAYDWANITTNVNGVTFNGVNSTIGASPDVSLADSGGGIGNNTTLFSGTTSPWSGLTPAYQSILQGGDYAFNNNTTITVSLNNLTVGKTYAVQLWVNDSRSGGTGTNTETAFSGSGSQVTLAYNVQQAAGGLGNYLIAYLTASSTNQSFTLLGGGLTQINALQVRDVTGLFALAGATPISGDTDVLTAGTTLYAYDWANITTNVNGVAFTGVNSTNGASPDVSLANSGGGIGNNTTAFSGTNSPWSLLSANYQSILQGGDYALNSNTTVTVSLNNLTVGTTYAVQLWVNDSRNKSTDTRTETAWSGSGSQVTLAYNVPQAGGGLGEYVTGCFTASATSQSLTLFGADSTQINALQVRDLTQLTWGAATSITNDADVLTAGTTLYAYDWANITTNVNGVAFTGVNSTNGASPDVSLANSGGGIGNNTTAFSGTNSPWSLLSANYQSILQGGDYALNSNTTVTVSLNNLTVGTTYAVQLWVNDSRNKSTDTRTETVSGPVTLAYNVPQVGGGLGQFVTGYFMAVSNSQSFTLLGTASSQINALQVRNVTGFRPLVKMRNLAVQSEPVISIQTMGFQAKRFTLSFTGPGGNAFRIFTSTNLALPLANWLLLTNGTFGDGTVNYTDEAAANGQGFYRVVSP